MRLRNASSAMRVAGSLFGFGSSPNGSPSGDTGPPSPCVTSTTGPGRFSRGTTPRTGSPVCGLDIAAIPEARVRHLLHHAQTEPVGGGEQ